jgi:hypothetical protein
MPDLIPHPHTPSRVAKAVTAQATLNGEGKLALSYTIVGDIGRLLIPQPAPARVGWKLWRHTCCEVFIRPRGAAAYHEFNFSPSGEWAAYAFESYRSGATITDEALNPQIAVRSTPTQLDLSALVDLPGLAPEYAGGPLSVGLAVVVEDDNGALSYWALRHAPGQPDFHHADAFALHIE